MIWDQMEGQWRQMKGKVKAKWGRLTDQDLLFLEGSKDLLVGKIQERYGVKKDQAERDLEEWIRSLPSTPTDS